MAKFSLKKIKSIAAPHFKMHPLELRDYIDFEIKRVYFITDPTGPTGSHCHKKEKEFFFMAQGTCVAVIDKGDGLEEIKLDVETGIYVGNYVWHHFKNFSPDAILMALSSTNYNPDRSDYIEDYEKFKEIAKEQK